MPSYAHVVAGVVRGSLFTPPDGHALADCFTPDIAGQYVAVPDAAAVNEGWVYDGKSFAAPVAVGPGVSDLLTYASDRQDAALAQAFRFNVAASGLPAHTVTTRLDAKGQFAMLKVQGWLTLNASTPGASMPYSNVDFSATTLTASEADSLVEQAAALDTQSYVILNQLAAGINASPPTVTTYAQVEAAFATLAPASAASA